MRFAGGVDANSVRHCPARLVAPRKSPIRFVRNDIHPDRM